MIVLRSPHACSILFQACLPAPSLCVCRHACSGMRSPPLPLAGPLAPVCHFPVLLRCTLGTQRCATRSCLLSSRVLFPHTWQGEGSPTSPPQRPCCRPVGAAPAAAPPPRSLRCSLSQRLQFFWTHSFLLPASLCCSYLVASHACTAPRFMAHPHPHLASCPSEPPPLIPTLLDV